MFRAIRVIAAVWTVIAACSFNLNTEYEKPMEIVGEVYIEEGHTSSPPVMVKMVKAAEPIVEVEPVPEFEPWLTDDEIDLIAKITMAEAEGESELGKRLVIDTILNRVDSELKYFPDTVTEVIYQPNQFSPIWNGRFDKCYVDEDIRELVLEEMESRTNTDVLYFHANKYGKYGTPLFSEGNHYFSAM